MYNICIYIYIYVYIYICIVGTSNLASCCMAVDDILFEQSACSTDWQVETPLQPPRYKVKDVTGGKIAGTFNRHAVRAPGPLLRLLVQALGESFEPFH